MIITGPWPKLDPAELVVRRWFTDASTTFEHCYAVRRSKVEVRALCGHSPKAIFQKANGQTKCDQCERIHLATETARHGSKGGNDT